MKAACQLLAVLAIFGCAAARFGGGGGLDHHQGQPGGVGPGHHQGQGGGIGQGQGLPPNSNSIPLANYNQVEGYNTFSTSQLQEFNNKNLVLNLYQDVFIPKRLDKVEKYIDTVTYINHNPQAPDGLAAFKGAFTATNGLYSGKPEVRQIAADGDLVWVHVKDDVNAYTDIFRIRNGKVVEHWDVIQALEPASSTSANVHPFF